MTHLFYEDERDAVRAMISNSGKSLKEAAHHLWPHMKPDTAQAKLRSQLNGHDDGEKLKFAEVVALMRWCGTYDPLHYLCDETNHARPARKAPNDEAIELANIINNAAETMRQAMARVENLQRIQAAAANK